MAKSLSALRMILFAGILSTALLSCQSSRLAGGFSYTGNPTAPDVGSSGQPYLSGSSPITSVSKPSQTANSTPDPVETMVTLAPEEKKAEARIIAQAMKEELALNAENGRTVTNRELVHHVTEKLVNSGQIMPVSPEKMKQLDKMALKMDKKAQKQGPDIDMKSMSGLEWFFIIMAAAGLVLVVFGGLFLYFKLVKDK